jgi:predicted AlkP superfamily phosphohydrolase/phosphomutase
MAARPPRVLALLFDAMDADLARGWAAEGACPNLRRLLAEAAVARTTSPAGFYVGCVWPSFSTALGPAGHGQYCWRQFDPATYLEEHPPYDCGEGEPFWATLDREGRRCLAFDVPLSIRVPLAHGLTVHDYATHDPLAPGYVAWPKTLAGEIVERFGSERSDVCNRWPHATAGDVRAFLDTLGRRIETKVEVASHLLDRADWDLAAISFGDAHCVGHQMWHVRDSAHPRHDPALLREVGDPLRATYATLDAALGRLLARAGEPTRVLVLLSHGMGPHYDGSHLLDRLLERFEATLPGVRPLTMGERWMRLRSQGERAKGGIKRLWRRFPRRRFRAVFALSNNEAWAAVRVNRIGREAHGRVAPQAYDAVLERVAELLRGTRNPATGTPAFRRVERTTRISSGARQGALPDLVAEWSRDGAFDALEAPGIGRVDGRYEGVRTGDHRPDGLALAFGPGIPRAALPDPVSILDLGPTVAGWLGVELARVDGRRIPAWSPAAAPPPVAATAAP